MFLKKIKILAARPKPISPEQLKKFLSDELYHIFNDKQAFGLIKKDGSWNKDFSLKVYQDRWFTRDDIDAKITIKTDNTITWEWSKIGIIPTSFYRFIFRQIGKRIFSKLHNYGWYVLRKSLIPKFGRDIYFVLEPYYGERVLDVPQYLYHTTSSFNKERILRKGLVPKQIGKISNHQNRVYVSLTKEAGLDFVKIMRFHGVQPEDYYYGGEYNPQVLLKIDTSKLRPGTKFYYDVETPNKKAAWTYTHIPPQAISVISDDISDDLSET